MGSTDRKPYSGIANFLNEDLVVWFTHMLPVVALSFIESAQVVVSDVCKDELNI